MKLQQLLVPLGLLGLGLSACGGSDGDVDSAEGVSVSAALPPDYDPPDCDDGNPCTTDTIIGISCRHTRKATGASCSDGNACNGAETCSATGVCRAGRPPNCNDLNSCTDDYCDARTGCYHSNVIGSCSDNNSCTVGDRCTNGVCQGQGSTSGPISAPAISDVTISAPAGSEVMNRDPIYYLEGNELDLSFRVPSCNYVTEVQYGLGYLTTAPRTDCDDVGGYDCQPNFYTVVRDVVLGTGEHELTIRLRLVSDTKDGHAIPVNVVVESALGQTGYAFTLSRVLEVSPSPLLVSFGQNDIHNALVAGIYQRFGDTGRLEVCNPGPCQPGESGTVAYDPDYAATDAWVDAAGVHIQTKFKVDKTCQPTIAVDGIFQLNNDLSLDWVDPVDAHAEFPWICDFVGGWLLGIVAGMATDDAANAVRDAVEGSLGGLVGTAAPQGIFGFDYLPGEVRARVAAFEASIAVEVPYDAGRLQAPANNGVPLRAGEHVVLTVANLVAGCDVATPTSQPCWGQSVGPNGLFNWFTGGSAGSPVPPPSPSVPGSERWEARQYLNGLARSSGNNSGAEVPLLSEKIGKLLGRLSSFPANQSLVLIGAGGCEIDTGVAGHLSFAPNDKTNSSGLTWGRGSRRIGITFSPQPVVAPCGTAPTSLFLGADPGPPVVGK